MIELFAINHKRGHGYFGGISKEFVSGRDDLVGDNISGLVTYGDMRAPYWIWKNRDDLDIIGFHGYRKFLDFRNILQAPGWYDTLLGSFNSYQQWLAEYDGQYIRELLAHHDIIVATPFDCSYNINIAEDFCRSRSTMDWDVVTAVIGAAGMGTPSIRPMHFVTRAAVFHRYMEWWWPHAEDIRSKIRGRFVNDTAYLERPMAYISERMYSLWLDRSNLSFVEVPLLQCWEAT